MAVGFGADKTAVDTRAGSLAVQIRETFEDIAQFQEYLAGKTDAVLIALGYTQAEVTLLKSAYTQLNQLRLVATGQATVSPANNFLFFSNQLTGVN